MSTLATADLPSEDEADQDFVPTLTSLHAEGDNHQGSSASSDSDGERPKKRRKKSAATANVPQEETLSKTDVDAIWASFNDVAPPETKPVASTSALPVAEPRMVTIKRVYEFAGQKTEELVSVSADSEEALTYLASNPPLTNFPASTSIEPKRNDTIDRNTSNLISQSSKAPAASTSQPKPGPKKKKASLASLSAKLANGGKVTKLTTLEKSKMDWDKHVQNEGMKEEMDKSRKSKGSYLERQDFLQRADDKKDEAYQKLKSGGRR